MRAKLRRCLVAACFGAGSATAAEQVVEVVHWWTSGGEAAALKVLKDDMQKRGYGWKDSPVAGGGGDQARTVLRARVAAGNPPEAMQMLGFIITDYAEEGLLGDLTPVATKEGWDKVVPAPLQKFDQVQGPLGRRAGQHPPHQLDLGQQEDLRRAEDHAAEDLR